MKKITKRSICLFLCTAMLLGYALVPGMLSTAHAETAPTNLLANASFESRPEMVKDWDLYTNPNTLTDYTGKYIHSGKMSVSFVAKANTSAAGITQTVAVTAGVEYTISAWTFVEGTTKIDRRMAYDFFDTDGTRLSTAYVRTNVNESSGWTEGKAVVTAPAGAVKLTVRIYTTKGTVAKVFVDDVSVTAAGSNTNLIKNPGFETYVNDIPGWYIGSAAATRITEGVSAADGTHVLMVDTYNAQVISTAIAAQPGKTYTASIKAYGADGAKPQLYIRFVNEDGTKTQKSVSTTKTAWDTLSVTLEAPADAKSVQLVLVCKGESAATAWYFDNASLVVEADAGEGGGGEDNQEPGPSNPDQDLVVPEEPDYEIVISDKNLIRNPLFEKTYYEKTIALDTTTAPTGWTISALSEELKAYKTNVTTVAGQWSLQFVDASAKSGFQVMQTIQNIQPGQDYISYYQYVGTGTPTLSIRFYDASNNMLKEYKYNPVCKENWSVSKKTNTAPEGSSYAVVMISTSKAAIANAYIDNLQFYLSSDTKKTNLLTNGSFEEYPDTLQDIPGVKKNVSTLEGWNNIRTGVELVKTTTQSDKNAVGNYMLKITDDTASGGHQVYYVVDVEPGKSYTFSAMLRGAFSYSAPQLLFQYFQDDNCTEPAMMTNKQGIQVASMKSNITVTEDIWTRGTYTVQAPEDAKKLRISLNTAKAALGWFYAGSLSLVEAMEEKFMNLGFDYVDDQGNMTAWLPYEDGKFAIDTKNVFAGDKAMLVTDNSTTLQQGAVQPLTDLTGYRIAGYATNDLYNILTARVKDSANTKGQIGVIYYDNNFVKITEHTVTSNGSGKWQLLKVDEKCPEFAVYAEIVVRVGEDASATGSVIFDDMTFVGDYHQYAPEEYDWDIKDDEGGRLYYNDQEFATLKEFIKNPIINEFGVAGTALYNALIAEADTYLVQTSWTMHWDPEDDKTTSYTVDLVNLPDINKAPELWNKPGGRSWPYLEGISTGIRDRMRTLALAYALTGDTRYADRAIDMVMKICEWEYWTETDYVWAGSLNSSLCTPRLTIGISTVYDMCYDRLTADQRKTISENIIIKGLAPLYFDLTGPERLFAHNKFMARCSGLMTGSLAIINEENKDVVGKYLSHSFEYAKQYLDSQYETGDQEGYSYTNVAVEEIIEGMGMMTRITGRAGMLDHPYFEEVFIPWTVDFLAPGGTMFPVYSDSYLSGFFQSTMMILNSQTGNGKAGYFLQQTGAGKSPFKGLLYNSANPVITPPTENDYVAFIEKVGYGGLRTGWEDGDLMLYIIGNNSQLNHNQYDQLTIQLSTDNGWLLTDPGYDNTEFGDSYGHNTIQVDGKAQTIMGQGALKSVIDGQLYGYIKGSAPNAYETGLLTQFDRHAIMINHGDRPYYIVIDELASQDDHVYDWVMNTGGWTKMEVDGKAFATGDSVKGNKLTVSGNNGLLYAEFISKNPLNIRTESYVSEKGVDNVLKINGGSAKKQQYMTLLTKAYGNTGDDEYSFIPLLKTMEVVKYETSSTDNVITKSVAVQGVPLFFFRGHKVGDWIEWPFEVAESGNFEIVLKTAKSYNYGTYKIYIDGKYVTTYDGYGERVLLSYFSMGKMDIEAGEHTLRLELVGTNSTVGGMLISMSSIIMKTDRGLEPSPIYTQEVYDTDKVLGAKIYHNEVNHDIVLFNRGTGNISAGGVTANAKQASIIGLMADGYLEGFVATDATSLVLNDKTLTKASQPITVSADFRGKAGFTVTSETAQKISLYAPYEILGATVDGEVVECTVADGMATISVPAGTHNVALKVANAVKYEYFEGGGTGTTFYDENGEITYCYIKKADGTEYLFEDGKVKINAYIDTATKLLVREELQENGDLKITYYNMIGNITKIEIEHTNGNLTTIKYADNGSISTTVTDKRGNTLEMTMEYPDGTKTKAEYLEDRTVTTKWNADGKVASVITIYKNGRRVEETYDANGKLASVITRYKGGDREEVIYNADGSVVTSIYKAGKLVSVHTKYADGTAVLVEYLEDGSTRITEYDADGNVLGAEKKPSVWLWIGIAAGVVAVGGGAFLVIYLIKIKKKNKSTEENEEVSEEA